MTPTERVIDPSGTPAWAALQRLSTTVGRQHHRDHAATERDFLRLNAAAWEMDASRQRITREVFDQLLILAEQTGVLEFRDAMRAGRHINNSEDRAVLHMALRAEPSEDWSDGPTAITGMVQAELHRMVVISERIRKGQWVGATGKRISHVLNIGIGGSDLGPSMVYQALAAFRDCGVTCLFVANVDPVDIHDAVSSCNPETTIVIISSKTFTTRETLSNAHVARDWLTRALGESAISTHFLAVSTNIPAAEAFGIPPESVVGFWEWVGGRYSVDSAIGLSLMIAIGPVHFRDFLSGFRDMDQHFLTARPARNLPVVMALCGIWNRDFLDIETVAVLPYSQRLQRFPAYLQQLTMESNGKSVRRDGSAVDYPTSAIYWGEPGTNGQHSFYQFLHQGTSPVACDVIIVAAPETPHPQMHDTLVANAFAQASVLSMGRPAQELSGGSRELVAHREIPGSTPVTILMTRALTPRSLGSLISLYEHMVFVQGAVWGINSFDQWGVEYGKVVAQGIEEDITAGIWDDPDLDESTRHSLRTYFGLTNRS